MSTMKKSKSPLDQVAGGEPPKKRIPIGLSPPVPTPPPAPTDDRSVEQILRWYKEREEVDAAKAGHPDSIPPVDTTKTPKNYRGMDFFPEEEISLRDMYTRIYGKEGAEKRLSQASARYAKNPEVDKLASLVNYDNTSKTPVFRSATDLQGLEGLTTIPYSTRTGRISDPSKGEIYLAKNAGSGTKLHELAHANQRFGYTENMQMGKPGFLSSLDPDGADVVNAREIAPWLTGLKVKYYQETGVDLYPDSPPEDYAKFLAWVEDSAPQTPRQEPYIKAIHKFITKPPPDKKDLVDEMLRQIATTNPRISEGSRV